ATEEEIATWEKRGHATKTFETGVVFGVEGDVIDSRELFLGVAPEGNETAATRTAKALSQKWGVHAFVHPEMIEPPRGTLVAREERSGTAVRNEGVLWFSPDGDQAITVRDVVHGGGGSQVGAEKKATRTYAGRIYVTQGRDGLLTVVNAVPEDRLLAGLVPSEIFPDAPMEALKAQAVAARDELLARIGTRHFADPFLLCSTQHCQVYSGVLEEHPRTTSAVRATRGEVLLRDGGGGLVPVYYSASCGGHGEHNENIWETRPDPSLRGRLDTLSVGNPLAAFSQGISNERVGDFLAAPASATNCGSTSFARGRYRWTVTFSAAKLDSLVAAEFPHVGSVKELLAIERGISGRIKVLRIAGARGTATVEGDLRIRRLLGGLRSSLFMARPEKSSNGQVISWTIDGAGFGHGVGMCQTGAIGMAEAGHDYRRILKHYFPGSHVRKLY
ncbi:MAG: SpoIID/LytB domain-containing protein, partial [Deltaproteobacteria bacterium]|nr:SpoIID/LytB domain-containing protein [Deltaproteobacteria bacterium]